MNRCLVIMLVVLSCWAVNCSAQNLSLHLNLDSNTFIESQDIWVTASVVNHSSDTQFVRRFSLIQTYGGIQFTLQDNYGKNIPQSVEGGMDADDRRVAISPHDSSSELFNLLGLYETSGSSDPAIYNRSVHFLKSGVYALDAITFTGKETLRAETVRFEVKQPSIEEAEVLILLKSADFAYVKRDKKSDEQYENIIKQSPNSVYIPYVYDRLIFIYRWVKEDKTRELDLVENFAKQYPNNRGALRTVQSHLPEFIKFNKKGVIESLARDHPKTRVGLYCKQKLEELQSLKLE